MPTEFTKTVIVILKKIPKGKVATYGQIAALAGSPRAARQVVRILHSSSEKYDLPWHRVVNSQGKISLKPNQGYEIQKALLSNLKSAWLSVLARMKLIHSIWIPSSTIRWQKALISLRPSLKLSSTNQTKLAPRRETVFNSEMSWSIGLT